MKAADVKQLIQEIAAMCCKERIDYRKAEVLRKSIYAECRAENDKRLKEGAGGQIADVVDATFRKRVSDFVRDVNKKVRDRRIFYVETSICIFA